ncbi:MAG: EAL domain-containing protein [Pseudomonadota bacterium]
MRPQAAKRPSLFGTPTDPVNHSVLTPDEQELVLHLQQQVLEDVALGTDAIEIVDRICLLGEQAVPNSVGSCMLLDETGQRLNVLAAPSVPPEGISRLNGLCPGPGGGSCGNAVFRKEPVFVENTLVDPLWADLRALARDFNILACWSMPIRAAGGDVIGSFALSSFEHRPPSSFHRKLLEIGAHLISIVLERQKAEKRITFLASHDPLTGLPNRTLTLDRLDQAIAHAQRNQTGGAVLFMDLDNFKMVNDTLGHQAGDALLCHVAKRLGQSLRASDSLGRWGGDEFVIILPEASEHQAINLIADKLLACMQAPIQLGNRQINASFSMGIAVFPRDGADSEILIHKADAAMYQAKAGGRNAARFFDQDIQDRLEMRAHLTLELRQALEARQFVLHYQPQVDLAGQVSGMEALVRWQHPSRGLIPPDQFIPIAEETGLILPLGTQILDLACIRLRTWQQKAGQAELTLSVNISPRQFRDEGFVDTVLQMLETHQVDPNRLILEITENVLLENAAAVTEKMQRLRNRGVRFSIDDFGTGYSSLAYLNRLPIDELKIDRSFVAPIEHDENAAAICDTFIGLAHLLGLRVVAEGVETEAQRQRLNRTHACDALQGYLFGKPAPLED